MKTQPDQSPARAGRHIEIPLVPILLIIAIVVVVIADVRKYKALHADEHGPTYVGAYCQPDMGPGVWGEAEVPGRAGQHVTITAVGASGRTSTADTTHPGGALLATTRDPLPAADGRKPVRVTVTVDGQFTAQETVQPEGCP